LAGAGSVGDAVGDFKNKRLIYAVIESLEDMAYRIIVDLGMIEESFVLDTEMIKETLKKYTNGSV
jgi:hypothetical protein